MQCTLVRRWCYSVHCFLHWLMWQFDEMVGWYKRIAVFKSCTLPSISHWCWWMQSIDELLPGLSSPHTLLKKQSSLGKISEKGLFNKIIPSPITGHLKGEGGLRQGLNVFWWQGVCVGHRKLRQVFTYCPDNCFCNDSMQVSESAAGHICPSVHHMTLAHLGGLNVRWW